MEIEEVAARSPEKILRVAIDPAAGLSPFHARRLAFAFGLSGAQIGGDGRVRRRAVPGVFRARRVADRDQSAGRDRRGRPAGARRQDGVRRQRAVPPSRDRGAARRGRGGPDRARGRQAPAQLRQARRQYRLHGQRRRARDGDDGHHQALRRQPGQFSRCRRRRDARAGHGRVQADPVRPQCRGDPGQHLRRHHALRRASPRASSRRRARSICTCRWSCGSKAPMSSSARRSCSQSGLPLLAAENLADAARKVVAAVKEARADGDPRRCRDQGDLPGLHRLAGHLPFRAGDRLRHQDGRRRDPGKRRHASSRPAGVRHRSRGARARPARPRASSTCRRPSPPTRSSKRSMPGSS